MPAPVSIKGGTIPISIPAPVSGKGGTIPLAMASPAVPVTGVPPAPPPPASRNAGGLMRMRDRPPTPSQRVTRAARDAAGRVGGGGRVRGVLLAMVALLLVAGGVFALQVMRETPPPTPEPVAPTATATATATAAPTASSAAPRTVDGKDAAAWREAIKDAVTTKEHARGIAALLALAEIDPGAMNDRDIRTAAASALVGAEFERSVREGSAAPSPDAGVAPALDAGAAALPVDRAWAVVAERLGPTGLDLLFEVARARAGTKAAARASALLRGPELAPRVSADMLVALDLATATCEGKKAYFARAASEGGARTLAELSAMRNAKCGRRQTACCFQNDKSLIAALEQLRKRLGK